MKTINIFYILYVFLALIQILYCHQLTGNGDKKDSNEDIRQNDCNEIIYNKCNHRSNFSEEEVKRALNFIQNLFINNSLKPLRKVCSKVVVRKDFKCLTHEERLDVVDGFRALYDNGVMLRLSQIHSQVWAQGHKSIQAFIFHRWIQNELEKEMQKIKPNIAVPYWDPSPEFYSPINSIIYQYFGANGNQSDNWCVREGPAKNASPCLKREWPNGQLDSWCPPEMATSYMQISRDSFLGLLGTVGMAYHFKPHLSIGGWNGHMSIDTAPYDPLFYLYHNYAVDLLLGKWQLRDTQNLIPKSYNLGWIYERLLNRAIAANITRDHLPYYRNTTALEVFQLGFGDLCYVYDQYVEDIIDLLDNKKSQRVEKFIKRLPPILLRKYYPRFASGHLSGLESSLSDFGECNQFCKPMPKSKSFTKTQNGRRTLERYRKDLGIDLRSSLLLAEKAEYSFINDFNIANYCSPYIV